VKQNLTGENKEKEVNFLTQIPGVFAATLTDYVQMTERVPKCNFSCFAEYYSI